MIVRAAALSFNDMRTLKNNPGDFMIVAVFSDGEVVKYMSTEETFKSLDIDPTYTMSL